MTISLRRFFTTLQVLILAFGMASSQSVLAATPIKEKKDYRQWIEQAGKKKNFSNELALIVKSDASVDPILENVLLSSSRRWEERWFSAIALGHRNNDYSKKALLKGIKDPLFIIRQASTMALGYLDDLETLKAIRASLNDSAMVVRSEAVDALVKRDDQFAASFLERELFESRNYKEGKSLWIRLQIVHALGQLGQPEGVKPLIKVLNTSASDKDIRYQACASLETIARKNQWEYPVESKKQCTKAWISWHQKRQDDPNKQSN